MVSSLRQGLCVIYLHWEASALIRPRSPVPDGGFHLGTVRWPLGNELLDFSLVPNRQMPTSQLASSVASAERARAQWAMETELPSCPKMGSPPGQGGEHVPGVGWREKLACGCPDSTFRLHNSQIQSSSPALKTLCYSHLNLES